MAGSRARARPLRASPRDGIPRSRPIPTPLASARHSNGVARHSAAVWADYTFRGGPRRLPGRSRPAPHRIRLRQRRTGGSDERRSQPRLSGEQSEMGRQKNQRLTAQGSEGIQFPRRPRRRSIASDGIRPCCLSGSHGGADQPRSSKERKCKTCLARSEVRPARAEQPDPA